MVSILFRNIVVYALAAVALVVCLDQSKVQYSRSRYLLGIFHNGHYQNFKDGAVYFDYMRRHEPGNLEHQQKLKYCYEQLKQH